MDKETKWCPWHNGGLGQMRPIEEFAVNRQAGANGRQGQCTACRKEHKAKYYAEHGITLRQRHGHARAMARRRGLEFNLTLTQYACIISQSCAYAIPASPVNVRVGIDRKNSAKGYIVKNCVPCCGLHNQFKNNVLTYDQMLDATKRYGIHCGDLDTGRDKLPRMTYEVRPKHSAFIKRAAEQLRPKKQTPEERKQALASVRLLKPRVFRTLPEIGQTVASPMDERREYEG